MKVVLNYCHTVLTLGHEINLPSNLQCPANNEAEKDSDLSDNFCTMLFNDETHTYDQVLTRRRVSYSVGVFVLSCILQLFMLSLVAVFLIRQKC